MSMVTPDHLLLGGKDLDLLIEDMAARTGVRAAYGGAHKGAGTHNALLDLGEGRYLELLAPIPGTKTELPLASLLADLSEPRLVAWAAATTDLAACVKRAHAAGYNAGEVLSMSRTPPIGPELSWQLALGGDHVFGSVLPFLIQWAGDAHPSKSAPEGCSLVQLRAEHPDPETMRHFLNALGAEIEINKGPAPRLFAMLNTPKGRIELT